MLEKGRSIRIYFRQEGGKLIYFEGILLKKKGSKLKKNLRIFVRRFGDDVIFSVMVYSPVVHSIINI